MLKVALLSETATVPTRKYPEDSGLDLYADLFYKSRSSFIPVEPDTHYTTTVVEPLSVVVVGTGIAVEIPEGHFGFITNKSSSDYLVGAGIVDSGYMGELLVKIFNPTDRYVTIKHGQKIAQLLIIPCKILDIEVVDISEIYKNNSNRKSDGGIARQGKEIFTNKTVKDEIKSLFERANNLYNSNLDKTLKQKNLDTARTRFSRLVEDLKVLVDFFVIKEK